jgi:hypothetical protein
MAYFQLVRTSNEARGVLNLKTNLIAARNAAEQLQREAAQMSETQLQNQFGFDGTKVQFVAVVDAIVTALQSAGVTTFISQVG